MPVRNYIFSSDIFLADLAKYQSIHWTCNLRIGYGEKF